MEQTRPRFQVLVQNLFGYGSGRLRTPDHRALGSVEEHHTCQVKCDAPGGTISAHRWRIADWRCEGNQRIDGIDLQIIEAANQFDCVAFEFDGMAWASQGVVKYLGAN
jgi:hypothetical protein